ncbi:(2Fe-2S)-binding protein [Ruegeria sp.]|uniref:(2Fe-2S)-binding protein n=1 Tax=Ruegeria sp. TaxID=1879320 RepID=UPI00231F0537|nr:(2Fe-2S)-binding protein [Ruegeria sp.]MDA7965563.1 (2Fe-2S)-binding protein [Ruegeria sp.]
MGEYSTDAGAETFQFEFDGQNISAQAGQSVAAALMQAGHRCLRIDEFGTPKGAFCGIGFCWECRCVIDGVSNERACMTPARPGMVVQRQMGLE